MSPTREHILPTLPENCDVKQSTNEDEDEDEEDREDQIKYEKDNAEAAYALRNDGEDGDNNTDDTADPGPFYVQSSQGDAWELTWPIWHLLPRGERQAIASQHGMKTIGEFEEFMSLTRAVDESEGGRVAVRAPSNYNNDSSMENNDSSGNRDDGGVEEVNDTTTITSTTASDWQPPFITKIEEEVEDDDSSVSSAEGNDTTTSDGEESDTSNDMNEIDIDELIKLGGFPCALPIEILHRAFSYLSIDDHASLALVSPYWARFTRCEALYKTLCERIYLNQSKRKVLHVSRFGNSYRRMLEVRPRVRTGGGLYVLKYEKVQKIERDMWTDIPVGAVLVNVYYRYLYFFEDGRVMYALTHISPMEMIPRFSKMLLHGYGSKDKWGVWGRYQIKKDIVRVWASQAWTDVCFQLKVIPSNKVLHYDSGDKGVCTTMKLEDHMTSISSNFDDDSNDLVRYDLPSGEQSYFRFLRDRRL